MSRFNANPGSIHVRVGTVLGLIEQAIAVRDWEGADMLVGTLGTYARVHMDDKQWKQWRSLPRFAFGDKRPPWQVLDDIEERKYQALAALKPHNVFSREEVPIGDGSSLDEPNEDSEEEELATTAGG